MKTIIFMLISIISTSAMAGGCRVIKKTDGWWVDQNTSACKITMKATGFSISYQVPSGYFMDYSSNSGYASVSQSTSSSSVRFRTGPYVQDEISIDDLDVGTYVKFDHAVSGTKPKHQIDRF